MPSDSIRYTVRLPRPVADYLDEVKDRRGLDVPAAVRRALGFMQAFDMETEAGRYVGATRDREALETVIATPL